MINEFYCDLRLEKLLSDLIITLILTPELQPDLKAITCTASGHVVEHITGEEEEILRKRWDSIRGRLHA